MSQTKAQLLGPLVADNVDVNGDLDFDSGTLKLDPTNNRVGINNSSPTTTLDVVGDIKSTGDITLKDLNYTADYPTIRPSLDLAFAQTKQLDSRITFTRDSTGTYVGTDGLIKTAAIDAPRFDHNPVTGESLGLLIEESRTNDVAYSENFNTWWILAAIGSVTANSATSPDGNNNGTLLVNNSPSTFTVNGNTVWYGGQIYKSQFTGPTTGTRTWSLFAKAKECDIISIIANTSGGSKQAYFDLSNGTVYFEPSDTTCRIEPYPNGWYKCSVTWNQGSSVYYTYNIQVFSSTEITGSDGIYIWGAQLEVGSFATSYIPTAGSAVTRSADYASITGTNFTNFYNQTEGTFYAEADTINPYYNTNLTGYDGNNNNYTVLGTGDTPNRFQLRFDDAFPYQVLGFGPNSTNAITSTTPTTTTTSMKIAGTVKQDYIRGYANGESILVDSTFDMISPSALYIGSLNGSTEINPGHIKRIMYYPRVLNNSQLQNITL